MFVGVLHPSFLNALLAITYSIGFIFVVIGRSELFTEHTTLAVIPVLNGNASLRQLLILWGLVYLGNLMGGTFFSFILAILPTNMGIITEDALSNLAYKMLEVDSGIMLGSGILAGWLMGLLSWLVTSSQETMSRIFIVTLVASVIGIGALHHSIVGSIEVLAGVFTNPEITFLQFLKFLLWTTIGNIIGGTVFVALIKYSHINPTTRYFKNLPKRRRKKSTS
jgi:formate/nitrite transporter FocA (FNT family)